ncbi:unnamed protein product [Allacma fusca]|uniref:Uncharacterized protein n=1 Tax=Allacma fusca TaxID=39272 RepID=A0A8J2KTU8_9HEXA|nr:unnamed protein product [Allacma fusca]
MIKSESVDMDDSLRLSELRKPKLFRRSVTVPQDMLSSSNDHKIIELKTTAHYPSDLAWNFDSQKFHNSKS